jgi:actin related protein 2/3 complex subunit 5
MAADEDDTALASALAERERAVDAALRAKNNVAALKASLEAPPLASKDAALKERNYNLILRALQAVAAKEDDLTAFFSALDADHAGAWGLFSIGPPFPPPPSLTRAVLVSHLLTPDVLMKYVNRGLSTHAHAALLLKVHGLLVERAGMGCLVRCIVDRRTA